MEADTAKMEELSSHLKALQASFTEMKAGANKSADDFYIVVVFRSYDNATAFLQKHGLPENRHQSGEEIARLCEGANSTGDGKHLAQI